MTYNLILLDAADADIADAIEHYELVSAGLSIDFELCLEEGYADILKSPTGYQTRYSSVRIKFIRRFPYGIHYIIEGNLIIVLAVFHQARNPLKYTERKGKTN